jgi:hypothetical protein
VLDVVVTLLRCVPVASTKVKRLLANRVTARIGTGSTAHVLEKMSTVKAEQLDSRPAVHAVCGTRGPGGPPETRGGKTLPLCRRCTTGVTDWGK